MKKILREGLEIALVRIVLFTPAFWLFMNNRTILWQFL